jgi:hypothetical protein
VDVPGPSGQNAWALVTTSFIVPAQSAQVQVSVSNSAGFVLSQNVYVATQSAVGANFIVYSIPAGGQTLVLTYLAFAGDVTTGSSFPVNSLIVPGTGNLLTNSQANLNAAYAVVETAFAVPAVLSTRTVTVNSSQGFVQGQNVFVGTPGSTGGNFLVTAVPSVTTLTLQFLGLSGDFAPTTTTVPIGALIVPGIGNQTVIGAIPGVSVVNGVVVFSKGLASNASNGVAPAAISFPATTVPWANPTSNNIEVYINSPSNVITAIAKNGQGIYPNAAGQTCFTLHLQPGETFTATYASGSPTARYSPF